jgi:RNA recognition motif-containing protein
VIISDKYTNRSKGFGFIEMSESEEAQKAIDTLNGNEFEGRTLKINEARPKTQR